MSRGADEISIEIASHQEEMKMGELENKIALYEKCNKIALNLYKVLKSNEIKAVRE